MGSAIRGLGVALPDKVLDNASLAASLGISEEWIVERTGIRERRIAAEDESLTDLAARAGAAALESAGGADVDALICATFTPDVRLPAAAPQIASRLGLGTIPAYDLNAACAGFLYALAQASALVESGASRRVLVIGADIVSRVTDYTDPRSCVLFGDGAGAVVVEPFPEARLGPFRLHADGARPEMLWMPPETNLIAMNGREVYRRAVDAMASSVREVLAASGIVAEDLDLVVAHQANARILRAVGERLALPDDKLVTNIAAVGNTSAASIPLALADARARGTLEEGDLVMLTAFGGGFAWGAGLLRWGVGLRPVTDEPLEEAARV